ncbi:hypothetical protein H6G33_04190 [Calothrix sp. FACHB-1219]|uniref:hypothetical protein n=1 Tax=unclassified Calothrix TaxID=2619626 RepID=UPI001685DC5C|nr:MULTISPECIES: hypothetical protein [unclassified Calothrix]MBD2204947.1 hypothetical protein [Calothrix sp. FACHB-168]MBD2216228.1 hypothetical protein [Calothrix sp. FACHB-1219]
MENAQLNAKTKKIHRRNSQPNGENDGQGLEGTRGCGFVNGSGEQNRPASRDCEKDYPGGSIESQREEISNGVPAGKILDEVLHLKEQFLTYTKSHQSHLEARLDAAKQEEQQFLSSVEILERRIKTALVIQEQTNTLDATEEHKE